MGRSEAVTDDTRVWEVEGHPIRIEYSAAALEAVRAAAVDGFCRFPRGGIEVGGVLFGTAAGDRVRIAATRPVACEYATGPSYVLSEKDELTLARVVESAGADPSLAGMHPVGWYHSHTRSRVFLSEQDLAIHNRYFPDAWQVALVVKPEPFGTCRAGFFFREGEGEVHREAPYEEFAIPILGAKARAAAPVAEAAPEPQTAMVVLQAEPLPEAIAPPYRQPPRRRWWTWALLLLAFCLFALAGGLAARAYWRAQWPGSLSLRVLDVGGQLQIAWDGNSRPVRESQSGQLEILDGSERVLLAFDHEKLRRGSVTYTRRSENVEIRLRVRRPGGPPTQEFAHFLGPPVERPAAAPAPAAAAAAVEPDHPPQPQEARPAQPGGMAPQPRRFDLSRLRSRLNARAQPAGVLPAPPALGGSAGAPAAALAPGEAMVIPPPPAPQPLPAAVKRPPAYTGPAAGRIIWTGQLSRGAALSIDGAHASSGFLTGELPGAPVRISAHPAELSGRGLVVYGASAHHEAPGPGNGWNETTYTPEARRAGDVLVIEPPTAQNGWKRLVLRSDTRALAVIVIDWKTAP
jgi:proteasome lid subunit RPN8/RPN11